jgi:hypothetical protein
MEIRKAFTEVGEENKWRTNLKFYSSQAQKRVL